MLIFALPPVPRYRGRQLGDLGGYRKGAGSSADRFSLVFRCRSLGKGRELGTPLMESAFVAVGLKCGSGGRRILRRFPISVGAAHWAARGFRALHTFLQPCRGDPRGRPPEPYRFSTNFPGFWVREALGPPAGGCAYQESTLIRLASVQTPSPFEGEGLRAGGSGTRPYGDLRKRFHTFVGAGPRPARQDSHRKRWPGKPRRSCGTAPGPNFCKLRAQWPGRNRGGHSDFAHRKLSARPKG